MWDDADVNDDGSLTIDGKRRAYLDADLGIPPERSRLPDTPAVRAFRKVAARELAAIRAKGQTLWFPAD
jgi:hypothetical protein